MQKRTLIDIISFKAAKNNIYFHDTPEPPRTQRASEPWAALITRWLKVGDIIFESEGWQVAWVVVGEFICETEGWKDNSAQSIRPHSSILSVSLCLSLVLLSESWMLKKQTKKTTLKYIFFCQRRLALFLYILNIAMFSILRSYCRHSVCLPLSLSMSYFPVL